MLGDQARAGQHLLEVALGEPLALGDHAEPVRARRLGRARVLEDLLGLHHRVHRRVRLGVLRLRAEAAVLGAAARLGVDQRAHVGRVARSARRAPRQARSTSASISAWSSSSPRRSASSRVISGGIGAARYAPRTDGSASSPLAARASPRTPAPPRGSPRRRSTRAAARSARARRRGRARPARRAPRGSRACCRAARAARWRRSRSRAPAPRSASPSGSASTD